MKSENKKLKLQATILILSFHEAAIYYEKKTKCEFVVVVFFFNGNVNLLLSILKRLSSVERGGWSHYAT